MFLLKSVFIFMSCMGWCYVSAQSLFASSHFVRKEGRELCFCLVLFTLSLLLRGGGGREEGVEGTIFLFSPPTNS